MLAHTLFNFFFDAVMSKAMAQHPGRGLKVPYNREAELVGSRQKMCGELSLHDLEYADNVALISDSIDALEEVMLAIHGSRLLRNGVNHQLKE